MQGYQVIYTKEYGGDITFDVTTVLSEETARSTFISYTLDALKETLKDGYFVDFGASVIEYNDELGFDVRLTCDPNQTITSYYFNCWDGIDSYKVTIEKTEILH